MGALFDDAIFDPVVFDCGETSALPNTEMRDVYGKARNRRHRQTGPTRGGATRR